MSGLDVTPPAPPRWLIDLIVVQPKPTPPRSSRPRTFWQTVYTGSSIADSYSASTSWADVLMPHGWSCASADPDADGAVWLHPTHTSSCSGTIKHGCLFVYSPNTPFEVTEAGNPKGFTKFRAYALLNHNNDMGAAARALREVKT